MTEFDNREKAFEKKFEIEEALKFKTTALSAKLFGQWAAEQLGLKGAEVDSYVKQVLDAEMLKAGHEPLLSKVEKDFESKNIPTTRHHLAKELNQFHKIAHEQLAGHENT